MDTSLVSEQERQSLEAVSMMESAMFPFEKPESEDVWSSVVFELPVTDSPSGSTRPLVGLDERLEDSCLCCLEPLPVSSVKLGIWSLPCVDLCSLLTSTSVEVTRVILVWKRSGESLGEWSHLPFGRMARSAKGCPTKGVPARGMSGKEDTGGGEVAGGGIRTPDGPETGKPQDSVSGTVGQGPDTMEMPLSCWPAVVAAFLI